MLEADIFKKVILRVHETIRDLGLPVKISLLLHDAIWFSCPRDKETIAYAKRVIQDVMENTVELRVPLKVKWE